MYDLCVIYGTCKKTEMLIVKFKGDITYLYSLAILLLLKGYNRVIMFKK